MNKTKTQESLEEEYSLKYYQKFLSGQNLTDFSQSKMITEQSYRESFHDDLVPQKMYDVNLRLMAEITRNQQLEQQNFELQKQLGETKTELDQSRAQRKRDREQMNEIEQHNVLLQSEVSKLKQYNEKWSQEIKILTDQSSEQKQKMKEMHSELDFKNDELKRLKMNRKQSFVKKINISPVDIKIEQNKSGEFLNRFKGLLAKTENSFIPCQTTKNDLKKNFEFKFNYQPLSPPYARTMTPYSNRIQLGTTYTGNWFQMEQQNSTATTNTGVQNDKSNGSQQSRSSLKQSFDQVQFTHYSRGSQGELLIERQPTRQNSIRERNCQIASTKEQILRLKQNLRHLNIIQ